MRRIGRITFVTVALALAGTGSGQAACPLTEASGGKTWRRTLTVTELLSVDGGVRAGRRIAPEELASAARYVTIADNRIDVVEDRQTSTLLKRLGC